MFLVDAAGNQDGIEVVPTHHEQAAIIAAEYYSRISGKLGVAVVTTGPGSTNAITGVAGAWLDSVPLLVLAGQVKTSDYNFGVPCGRRALKKLTLSPWLKKLQNSLRLLPHSKVVWWILRWLLSCLNQGVLVQR